MYVCKNNLTLYFTHLPRSPPWKDLRLNWYSGSSHGRNQLWQLFFIWQPVKGFGFCRGPKFVISHWLSRSPLTQCWRYRAARDSDRLTVTALNRWSIPKWYHKHWYWIDYLCLLQYRWGVIFSQHCRSIMHCELCCWNTSRLKMDRFDVAQATCIIVPRYLPPCASDLALLALCAFMNFIYLFTCHHDIPPIHLWFVALYKYYFDWLIDWIDLLVYWGF